MYDFCTYFDSAYIFQGLVLLRSLRRQLGEGGFRLFVVALDEGSFEMLSALAAEEMPELRPERLSDVEAFDPDFAACAANRSKVEYYFTLSPVMPLYLFERHKDIGILNYLDSDLYFMSSPKPLYDELGGKSLLIVEHRFPRRLKRLERCGRFNVQFQLYRNDEAARGCLRWWRGKCLEWCRDQVEAERYADQKYLDKWPELFADSLVVSREDGAGLAPWNWMRYGLRVRDGVLEMGDGSRPIFYHFQGFRFINPKRILHNLGSYLTYMPEELREALYGEYARALLEEEGFLKARFPERSPALRFANNRTNLTTYLKSTLLAPFNAMSLS
jgi:hypothetical protein